MEMTDKSIPKVPNVQIIPVNDIGAPFIYFDNAQTFGINSGVVHVTLDATRFLSQNDKESARSRVAVAHLRMSLPAAVQLRRALDGAILAATPNLTNSAN